MHDFHFIPDFTILMRLLKLLYDFVNDRRGRSLMRSQVRLKRVHVFVWSIHYNNWFISFIYNFQRLQFFKFILLGLPMSFRLWGLHHSHLCEPYRFDQTMILSDLLKVLLLHLQLSHLTFLYHHQTSHLFNLSFPICNHLLRLINISLMLILHLFHHVSHSLPHLFLFPLLFRQCIFQPIHLLSLVFLVGFLLSFQGDEVSHHLLHILSQIVLFTKYPIYVILCIVVVFVVILRLCALLLRVHSPIGQIIVGSVSAFVVRAVLGKYEVEAVARSGQRRKGRLRIRLHFLKRVV